MVAINQIFPFPGSTFFPKALQKYKLFWD